ncbi:MAG: type II secretion system protein [bacterium]|nr:type II secretion system protein [bacterium]
MQNKGFTLAEVLITLAIIGVIAAISIPSVISNSQQQEFKTGLRKAVSVLNSAITMNMALDGETPYDNSNLFGYMMKHMAVMETLESLADKYCMSNDGGTGSSCWGNGTFYTTDGMRFEFYGGAVKTDLSLYESPDVKLCLNVYASGSSSDYEQTKCGGCGSYGLNNNTDNTTKAPCLISVDVNGDRKPNPANINCIINRETDEKCRTPNKYKFSDPEGKKLTDIFSIMVTDKEAIPYGVAAQRAMYNSQ